MTPQSEPLSPKKAYTRPKLVIYGDLREMTLSTGNSKIASADGGSIVGQMKTA